jgi:hypothetical protein
MAQVRLHPITVFLQAADHEVSSLTRKLRVVEMDSQRLRETFVRQSRAGMLGRQLSVTEEMVVRARKPTCVTST